ACHSPPATPSGARAIYYLALMGAFTTLSSDAALHRVFMIDLYAHAAAALVRKPRGRARGVVAHDGKAAGAFLLGAPGAGAQLVRAAGAPLPAAQIGGAGQLTLGAIAHGLIRLRRAGGQQQDQQKRSHHFSTSRKRSMRYIWPTSRCARPATGSR